jgi:Spy/CpxP family protein refolding chaperone
MPCGASSSSQVFWYQHQNLSEEQLQKLDELRTAVEAARVLMRHAGLSDDNALLRFLQARSWNVGKAAAMYEVSGRGLPAASTAAAQ